MQMEHAMTEEMCKQVDKGELSEAHYKHLVESMGNQKEEVNAPLFEVTYTAHMTVANSVHGSGLTTTQHMFDLHQGAKTKIVRGVTKYRPYIDPRKDQFINFDEIIIGSDGEPHFSYKPGRMFVQQNGKRHYRLSSTTCVVVYTILKIRKFKKRKSNVLSEELEDSKEESEEE